MVYHRLVGGYRGAGLTISCEGRAVSHSIKRGGLAGRMRKEEEEEKAGLD